MEEGRRWKKGGEGGIRRGIKWFRGGGFLGIFLESSRENFQRRIESKKGWNREGRKLEEGVNSRGADLHLEKRKVAIWFISTWDQGLGNPSIF